MAPETQNETPVTTPANETTFSPVTRTVFDLTLFDDVKLSKPFTPPTKPTTVAEALAAVGNDSEKLLTLIYEGMVSESRTAQYNDLTGFLVVGEDGKATEPYNGNPASEEKGKLINGAILNMAKMFAGGSWDTLKGEDGRAKKAAFRKQAEDMLRANPAALASLAG